MTSDVDIFYTIPKSCSMYQPHVYSYTFVFVDPGGPVVIILVSGSEVRGFDPGRGRWIFSESKNPEYASFGREVKPWGSCRRFTACKRTSSRN